ncbi:MAG: hypothetical protein OK439_07490 [Thaumarchaeota archaeon]|nr:hypothetical protein [Nitrososphaerota archaeon]
MGRNQNELPFAATFTVFAMLSGFVLVFLLPYDALLAWGVFIVLEAAICFVILRRFLKMRRTILLTKSQRS